MKVHTRAGKVQMKKTFYGGDMDIFWKQTVHNMGGRVVHSTDSFEPRRKSQDYQYESKWDANIGKSTFLRCDEGSFTSFSKRNHLDLYTLSTK